MSNMSTEWIPPKLKGSADTVNGVVVNLRCPICMHQGAFSPAGNINDLRIAQNVADKTTLLRYMGVRICPNPECRAYIFVILGDKNTLLRAYPPELIDFDATNLPPNILATLEEAIRCDGAGCYKAAALMVRRLLEELCENRGAKGKDLKDRLLDLGSSVVMPKELLGAADELRLLGNDAAHVVAKTYDAVGEVEATLSIELAKELLKAVFQYGSLLERLRALKKTDAT